ncbi:MAG: glycerol-3-phosphate acyltransferase [Acidimicrobiia bacterium]
MDFAIVVVVVLSAYCIGSIPVAVVIGRRHGMDPRAHGDRNPGYWNMQTQLGTRRAVPVFIGDTVKGVLAGLLGGAGALMVGVPWWTVGLVAVAAAMIGHAWPVFARFRGGRSILVFSGGVCAVIPLAAAAAIVLCIAVALLTRTFAYGARAGVFLFPLFTWWIAGWQVALAAFACMSIIGLRFAMAAIAQRRSGAS